MVGAYAYCDADGGEADDEAGEVCVGGMGG